MFGFETPRVDVVAANAKQYDGNEVQAVSPPPGGLADNTSDRRRVVVAGCVVDAICPVSPDTNRGSYHTWRPVVAFCQYFD